MTTLDDIEVPDAHGHDWPCTLDFDGAVLVRAALADGLPFAAEEDGLPFAPPELPVEWVLERLVVSGRWPAVMQRVAEAAVVDREAAGVDEAWRDVG